MSRSKTIRILGISGESKIQDITMRDLQSLDEHFEKLENEIKALKKEKESIVKEQFVEYRFRNTMYPYLIKADEEEILENIREVESQNKDLRRLCSNIVNFYPINFWQLIINYRSVKQAINELINKYRTLIYPHE